MLPNIFMTCGWLSNQVYLLAVSFLVGTPLEPWISAAVMLLHKGLRLLGHTCIKALVLAADGAFHAGSNSIQTPASHAEQATGGGSTPAAWHRVSWLVCITCVSTEQTLSATKPPMSRPRQNHAG